ncbi:hypothetical protein L596_017648 [Steinernema carpocapsae]|uniref:Protein kinase domain-containing protein n=1 Tax=Steinernema carpocapsae TaxID=34508 RepID=A0A4U5N2Q0_STECR|nr:hypothetical protein L596_017648 [Steinernema carpocapsae]
MQCGGPISSAQHPLMQRSHSQDFAGGPGQKSNKPGTPAPVQMPPNSARGVNVNTGSKNQLTPGPGMPISRSVNESLGSGNATGNKNQLTPGPGFPTSRSVNDSLGSSTFSSTSTQPLGSRQFLLSHTNLRPPSPSVLSPSPGGSSSASSTLVRNARSPKYVKHNIPHRWYTPRRWNMSAICTACQTSLGFMSNYEKCKSCKLKIHKECKGRIGDTCGLTPDHLSTLIKDIIIRENQSSWGTPSHSMSENIPTFHYPDTEHMTVMDSSSSTNSSTPSTPAIITTSYPYLSSLPTTNEESPTTSPYERTSKSAAPRSTGTFTFDEPHIVPHIILPPNSGDEVGSNEPGHNLVESQGSDCTVASSETTVVENHLDVANNFAGKPKFERNRWNNDTIRGPSGVWSELYIPFDDIKQMSLIGKGRFGKVYRGKRFGDVALKMLNLDHIDEEQRLAVFKQEVASFRNSRHELTVLFLGWTTNENKDFGIVMDYCKGSTLHQILHGTVRPGTSSGVGSHNIYNSSSHAEYDRLDLLQTLNIAEQICQGVSYLHTKKILHKDLRSKNIFVEGNKIVITDYGVFSMKRIVHNSIQEKADGRGFVVPKHWLCYLAPELIRSLTAQGDELPFTTFSDVFAFGTIWYELLTQNFPYDQYENDIIMYLAGKGIKGALQNLTASRECKMILMKCWNAEPLERVTFLELSKIIANIIRDMRRKRMNRSPSYPQRNLSRSLEAL